MRIINNNYSSNINSKQLALPNPARATNYLNPNRVNDQNSDPNQKVRQFNLITYAKQQKKFSWQSNFNSYQASSNNVKQAINSYMQVMEQNTFKLNNLMGVSVYV